jgi:hypothetical protein
MHMFHHVTNHLIISNDKGSNSENRIKLRICDTLGQPLRRHGPLIGGLSPRWGSSVDFVTNALEFSFCGFNGVHNKAAW